MSGRSIEGRDGFRALVSRIYLARSGGRGRGDFELDIFWLARSSADLWRLLGLAG